MKLLTLPMILLVVVLSSVGCSKQPVLSHNNHNGTVRGILGKWRAIGYYSTYFMSSNPSKKWVTYSSNEQFIYEFGADGKLGTIGNPSGCRYQRYSFSDSINLQLFSNTCDNEKYRVLKLTTDSLYLSKAWYENQYIYVFAKIHQITKQ